MYDPITLPPDPARVMEGLRDTGYSFNTAMADLIDNSIAANATLVKVNLTNHPVDHSPLLYIADNGCGMDKEDLMNAMKYGSKRRQDAASLGKFGLGLKTASTAFCRCLSLVSRGKDNVVRKVTWDLDYISEVNKWELKQSDPTEDELELLDDAAKGGTGTLVVWEKVDRLVKAYQNLSYLDNAMKRMIDGLNFHLSMVFQRYLDPKFKLNTIDLYVNDERILPWDPFCTDHECTKLLASKTVTVEDEAENKQTGFTIEAYLLPRVDDFSSPKAKRDARINNDMQGFYVYRENRLIYFGRWLGICTNDPHISLLRVNFSFDHSLDDHFDVDIKKSKINLSEEIFQWLSDFLKAPRRAAEDLYRKGRTDKNVKAGATAHDASGNIIEGKAPSLENSHIDVTNPATGEVKISNKFGDHSAGVIKIAAPTASGNKRVIPVDSITDGLLWEPTMAGGAHAVSINQSHDYYTKVYAPNLTNQTLITGMDSLLWALSEAELSTYNEEVKEQYVEMRIQVSRILRGLVKELPDPEPTDN